MADSFKSCSVADCKGNSHYSRRGARGMCSAHYQRLMTHGDPLAGGARHGEPLKWLHAHAKHTADECLIWPFSNFPTGYGQVRYLGRSFKASRVMCIIAHGAPSPRMEAAHSCGKGHEGCVNPAHLRWDTPKGNCADRAEHGTENRGEKQGGSKLTEAQVREIRSQKNTRMQRELAKDYGVSRMTISDVLHRRTWAWLN